MTPTSNHTRWFPDKLFATPHRFKPKLFSQGHFNMSYIISRQESQGRSQDFSKGGGGHTVSNNMVMALSPRNIVG